MLGVSLGHNIVLGAHSRECFHEQLHKDDKMTVTFQVGDREFGGAGNLDVDFWVRIAADSFHCLHGGFPEATRFVSVLHRWAIIRISTADPHFFVLLRLLMLISAV